MRWQAVQRSSLVLLVVRFVMFDVLMTDHVFSGKTTTTGGLGDNISDEDLKEFFAQSRLKRSGIRKLGNIRWALLKYLNCFLYLVF